MPSPRLRKIVLYELPQGRLGGIYTRDKKKTCRDLSTNLLLCQRKVVGRHHIPRGYNMNYWGLLSDAVRPLISRRDQRRLDNTLDHAIQLLYQDIQHHIRQEVQGQ